MSELTETLRTTMLLVPMENGGEMVTQLGHFAADCIDELTELVIELDAHEGAEGWSKDLEQRLVKFRKENSDE